LLLLTDCRDKASRKAADQWADYRKAYGLLANNPDSAFYYFNRSATNSTNKAQIASGYQSMAFIQSNAGDNYGAQESLILSLKSLDERDAKNGDYLARDYNGLGMTYSNLNEYDQALTYYQLALRSVSDTPLRSNILNNQGNAYKDSKSYIKALACYQAAIKLTGSKGTIYARVLTNLAITKWLQNSYYNAVPELLRSLAIRLREKDMWGENSSYAHLADFYMDSKPDSALWYARKMFVTACQLKSPDDELTALRKLIILVPAQSKMYFQWYQHLEDSVQTTRSAARNQFAVIRYNVEKAKAENLQLEGENAKRRYELIGVTAAAVFVIIIGFWWYSKRKERLRLETENEIRQNKLLLSQKVHDDLSNGIYRVMSELEHSDPEGQRHLIGELELMYKKSRNISYEADVDMGDFTDRLGSLINAFKQPSVKFAVAGNEPALWRVVNANIKNQLELILQELMVNMNKHSMATFAALLFSIENNCLQVDYRDNGVGMPEHATFGNGLRSTVSRIHVLMGTITFDDTVEKGVQLHIRIPLV